MEINNIKQGEPIRFFSPEFTNPDEAQIFEERDSRIFLITDLMKVKVVHLSDHKAEAVLLEHLLCFKEANNRICDTLSVLQKAEYKRA